jgi:hypothetical protein
LTEGVCCAGTGRSEAETSYSGAADGDFRDLVTSSCAKANASAVSHSGVTQPQCLERIAPICSVGRPGVIPLLAEADRTTAAEFAIGARLEVAVDVVHVWLDVGVS